MKSESLAIPRGSSNRYEILWVWW